jgi:pimeloyl-ACP methyl ester carboxylesterase
MQFPGKLGDLGYGLIMRQLLPNYFVRRDLAPKFDGTRTSKRGWRGTNRSIKSTGETHLDGISVAGPVLIIRGDEDPIRETHAVLIQRFPQAIDLIIPQAGHFPWLEHPELFAATVRSFYREAIRPA